MRPKKKILTVLFLFILFCFIGNAQTTSDKIIIDTAQVAYAEIKLVHPNGGMRVMTKEKIFEFSQKWKTAKILGADKYKPIFFIQITLKSGEIKQFTIKKNKIQESKWLTYDVGDEKYFEKLWEACK